MVISSSLKDMTSTIKERRQIASCSPTHPVEYLFAPGTTHAPGARASRPRRVYEGKMPSLPGAM